jgi:dihydroorotase
MKIVLQNINVISPGSVHHLKERDIVIDGEKIISVNEPGLKLGDEYKIISGKKFYVSPGWFDLHVNFSEPGNEYKEDIESGCRAAVQGGFTGVLVMPTTDPPVSNRPSVEYILSRAKKFPVNLYVAGTISDQLKGKELSEMFDMYQAGTRVFTDDKTAVQDAGLMTRALLYAQNFGGKIFSFPEDQYLSGKGLVHEGTSSTSLGIKGIPGVAEEIMISRDLLLAEYTKSQIHFSSVSSKNGVELIRQAKAKGMKITSDVSATHLFLDDSFLSDFDSVYKLKPPLRTTEDKNALINGLVDGTIDCICSDHSPQDTENKKKEFELASYGAAGIETAFAVARTATKDKLSLPELISKFTIHPRICAGLKPGVIDKDHIADLTIFDADAKWIVDEKNIKSKSNNNPFMGRELTGKPIAVINKGELIYCS